MHIYQKWAPRTFFSQPKEQDGSAKHAKVQAQVATWTKLLLQLAG